MEKFINFLHDKKAFFLTKKELKEYYEEFSKMWKVKPFEKAFDSLRKTRLTYLFNHYWTILQEEPVVLFELFLEEQGVPHYYGLQTAMYFNQVTWQAPKTYYLVNTKYSNKRTVKGMTIQLVKFPEKLINKHTILKKKVSFSDKEKTFLDMQYYYKQDFRKKFENLDDEKLTLYAALYDEDFTKVS